MYQRLPQWVLGFHGTDEDTVKQILNSQTEHLNKSENDYDWIGAGIYFWENDPVRALEFSRSRMKWKKITDKKPAVIGAVIDLGLCLNLFDQKGLKELKAAYEEIQWGFEVVLGNDLPVNEGETKDRLFRKLDCFIIEGLHGWRKEQKFPEYQTVRSGFHEGDEAFPGSEFRTKNHIQIAVRDTNCIKGYFLPRKEMLEP